MLEQVFARLSSSPFSLSVLPFQIYRQIEFCSEVGGGMWPPGGVCVRAALGFFAGVGAPFPWGGSGWAGVGGGGG